MFDRLVRLGDRIATWKLVTPTAVKLEAGFYCNDRLRVSDYVRWVYLRVGELSTDSSSTIVPLVAQWLGCCS